MAASAGDDVGVLQWAIGIMATAGLAFAGVISTALHRVRDEDASGRKAIWERMNERFDKLAEQRAEEARLFATRADLDELRRHIDGRMDSTLREMRDLIANRPPLKVQP